MRHLLLSLSAAAAAAVVYQNPTEFAALQQISICAGNVNVKQDPRFNTLLPAQAQTLPLDYCAPWPIWVTKRGGNVPVARVPMPEKDADLLSTFCPPASFEQLWLPDDLPQPRARAAIGLVLRNGDPRYVFPTLDTFLETSDGVLWRNRGLNSVPLASTWLHFGEIPVEALRLSVYAQEASREQPSAQATTTAGAVGEATDGASHDGEEDGAAADAIGPYRCVLPNTAVDRAVDEAFDALAGLPPLLQKTSLGDGFCYLIVPLECDGASSADGLFLPSPALTPGSRLRAFLSQDGDDENDECWQRGELDLTLWRLPPGKESPYMQSQYRELYGHAW